MGPSFRKMLITDFDGTIFHDDGISDKDMSALVECEEMNICRVIATGRSVYSIKKVIPDDFPIDYLVFSSGAGIMHWSSKEVIRNKFLEEETTRKIIRLLKDSDISFMVHKPIPDNHHFYYYGSPYKNGKDFNTRLELYKDYIQSLASYTPGKACQFLCILETGEEDFFKIKKWIEASISRVRVIRTTSPLNGHNIWLEIFPEGVSKGHACKWLSRKLNIDHQQIFALGNDYNDLDMLEWAENPFVVSRSPDLLVKKYNTLNSATGSLHYLLHNYVVK